MKYNKISYHIKINKKSTYVHISMLIIGGKCSTGTQHGTEQFWQSSLLPERPSLPHSAQKMTTGTDWDSIKTSTSIIHQHAEYMTRWVHAWAYLISYHALKNSAFVSIIKFKMTVMWYDVMRYFLIGQRCCNVDSLVLQHNFTSVVQNGELFRWWQM